MKRYLFFGLLLGLLLAPAQNDRESSTGQGSPTASGSCAPAPSAPPDSTPADSAEVAK